MRFAIFFVKKSDIIGVFCEKKSPVFGLGEKIRGLKELCNVRYFFLKKTPLSGGPDDTG